MRFRELSRGTRVKVWAAIPGVVIRTQCGRGVLVDVQGRREWWPCGELRAPGEWVQLRMPLMTQGAVIRPPRRGPSMPPAAARAITAALAALQKPEVDEWPDGRRKGWRATWLS